MAKASDKYEAIIGLEVHAQLLTASKLFCACLAEYGAPPNSLTCPVCLGHPGTLPVVNRRAVEFAVKTILAVGGEVQRHSGFARKNYFYPDLPKGYQISQYDRPLGLGGQIQVDLASITRQIGISRIHLEEDAGKLLHPENGEDRTRIDFNRCGVPLIEIVSEPEIHTPQEAHVYLNTLKQILQYLDVCSGDMEKGALRCDANLSVRRKGQAGFGVRTELKNLNSFKAVEMALTHEIDRQSAIIDSGQDVIQATLLWNDRTRTTETMREKEESEDYRYFPEPDLIELDIDDAMLCDMRVDIPELPDARRERFVSQYGLPACDAGVLTTTRQLADYFESAADGVADKKLAANWVMGELLGAVRERSLDLDNFIVTPVMLAELLQQIESGTISGKIAKEVFARMTLTGKSATAVIDEKNLRQITNEQELTAIIEKVLDNRLQEVQLYREGKTRLFDYFVGQVMKATGGRANPEIAGQLLRKKLDG